MKKSDLEARAARRKTWAQSGTSEPLAEEIAKVWMQEALSTGWDPSVQDRVPSEVPVGSEFETWIDTYARRSKFRWREVPGAIDALAKEVARVIDTAGNRLVGKDFPNPLTGVDKEGGYLVAKSKATNKVADTIYGPVKYPDRHRNQYDSPFEWTRYSPDSPGIQLQRVGDGIYQDPVTGEVYEYQKGVPNQTNLGWNETWPQKPFLDLGNQQSWENKELQSHGKPDKAEPVGEKRDVPAGGKTSNVPYHDKRSSMKGNKKRADKLVIDDKVFGPPQVKTRYCPDHEGVMLYRITDDVAQCPLDRAVYDFAQGFTTQDGREFHGGSVAEMTPDRADYYQSPHALLQVSSLKGLNKKGFANLESRFAFDLSHALTSGSETSKKVLQYVIEGVMKRGKTLIEAIRDAYTIIDQSDQEQKDNLPPEIQ